MPIPVIDLFAGPGGLGEGFSALRSPEGTPFFQIVLSIEKEYHAHQTLTLRSFFRQFPVGEVPDEYYAFIKGMIDLKALYDKWPFQAAAAKNEAWCATLGEPDEKDTNPVSNEQVDLRINSALEGRDEWILIGGPPCQAYSVVGRVRRGDGMLDASSDKRVDLYTQYLRILAVHKPSIFVMENVKGLLSAETKESSMFTKILNDLSNPAVIYPTPGETFGYKIYSLTVNPTQFDENGYPVYKQKDFVIPCENYGIPQTRHRIILVGIRDDLTGQPNILNPTDKVNISAVISDLPRLRSKLSKGRDHEETWRSSIKELLNLLEAEPIGDEILAEIREQASQLEQYPFDFGKEFIECKSNVKCRPDWFSDIRVDGVANHVSRGHMKSDLWRYLYCASFAKVKSQSPRLSNFPRFLLPNHKNVLRPDGTITKKFEDRFRVQNSDFPSKTITSHISQDGHYFIHPDPTQCRSFTVREAARIQTFPDNYFFCGSKTAQFKQVGNAVPPYLAFQIARSISEMLTTQNKKASLLEKHESQN